MKAQTVKKVLLRTIYNFFYKDEKILQSINSIRIFFIIMTLSKKIKLNNTQTSIKSQLIQIIINLWERNAYSQGIYVIVPLKIYIYVYNLQPNPNSLKLQYMRHQWIKCSYNSDYYISDKIDILFYFILGS